MKTKRQKPENKTHLSGKRLVSKRNGRIAFRGMIDTLEAEFLEAQVLAANLGETYYSACLGEIFKLLQTIMAAEVSNQRIIDGASIKLFGLSAEEIHLQSHEVQKTFGLEGHPLPEPSMGPLALRINYLRARVREGELLAVKVFGGFFGRRDDIPAAMNRLSSALWWLFCKYVSGCGMNTLHTIKTPEIHKFMIT